MLWESRASSWDRLSLAERQQIFDSMTETGPQKGLTNKETKRKSSTKANFHYQDQKL